MQQVGLPGNICCANIWLGKGFDVQLLRRRIAESPLMGWLSRAHIRRSLALFPQRWRTTAKPKAILFEHNEQDGEKPRSFPTVIVERELHAKCGPGLAFDVVHHADGTSHLCLSWNHTYLDARGLDLLLNHLNVDSVAKGAPTIQNLISPKQKGSDLTGWWSTLKQAHGKVKWLNESGAEPLFSLVPAGPRPRLCRNNHRVILFTGEETARIDARCQKFSAGFRRSHFYLASSIRALHNVAVQRGNQTGAYLIPVPHDTRRRGATGPIFSNHLSILFYRIEPKHTGRFSDILGELGRQMTDQIRDRFPESCMAALEMFKPLPLGIYMHQLSKPTRNKIATFCFSDSGDTCAGLTQLWGGEILDVTHLVPCWRPPGLTVVFLRFRNRLSALVSSVDDCLIPAEVDAMERDIRTALLEAELS